MQQQPSSSTLTVTDMQAGRLLTDPARFRFFEPFFGQVRSVGQAAAILGCRPNSLLAQVRRFLACGLLLIAREQPRAGRAIKFYRSSADAYFVPHDLLHQPGSAAWHAARLRLLLVGEGYGRRQTRLGTRVFLNARGVPSTAAALDAHTLYDALAAGEPASLSTSHDALYLDYADAKSFQRELEALMQRYGHRGGAQRYLAWLNLVPLPPDFEPAERYGTPDSP